MTDHVAGLLARGHSVEIFCPPEVSDLHPRFPQGVRQHHVPLEMHIRDRAWSPTPIAPVVLDRLHALRRHASAAGKMIARGSFDVLYSGACRFTRAPLVAAYVPIPSVLYLGEPYRWLYEALPELPLSARPLQRRNLAGLSRIGWLRALRKQAQFELLSAQAFGRILVNSRFSRESVLRAYGIEASVCRLGVDISRFPASPTSQRRHQLVGVGAVVPEKRIAAAVEAIARLPGNRPALEWIGNVADPKYAEHCRRTAERLDVELRLAVDVTDEDLLRTLHRSKAMIYAPRLEPFGYAPLEAAAAGLPVVAIAEGGVRETVLHGETGLLVDGSGELTQALELLLRDQELAARLGEQARQNVMSRWDLTDSIARLEDHLMSAAGGF